MLEERAHQSGGPHFERDGSVAFGLEDGFVEGALSCSAWLQARTATHDQLIGTSWRINLRIASGPC